MGIPYLYVATGLELAETLSTRNPQLARQVLNDTKAVASAMRIEGALGNIDQILPQISVPSGDSAKAQPLPIPPPATKRP